MGNPVVFTVNTAEGMKRRAEKRIRGLLVISELDAYVTVKEQGESERLAENQIEVTVDVNSPDEAKQLKQKILDIDTVEKIE